MPSLGVFLSEFPRESYFVDNQDNGAMTVLVKTSWS